MQKVEGSNFLQPLSSPYLRGFPSSGGRIWTHFPDRLAYRFIEVRRL
jgi:hypothetical protein